MTYLEKEQAILAKLQSQNYAFFDGDKEEAFDFLGPAAGLSRLREHGRPHGDHDAYLAGSF